MLEAKAGTFAEVAFLESVANGSFELVALTQSDAARIAELVARYDDLPLDDRVRKRLPHGTQAVAIAEETVRGVEAVIVFRSVARGDAHEGSDVHLVVIAAATWGGQAELQQQVRERLGNDCDVLHLTSDHFKLAPEDREPVASEILRDGITLVGTMPRPSRVAS